MSFSGRNITNASEKIWSLNELIKLILNDFPPVQMDHLNHKTNPNGSAGGAELTITGDELATTGAGLSH